MGALPSAAPVPQIRRPLFTITTSCPTQTYMVHYALQTETYMGHYALHTETYMGHYVLYDGSVTQLPYHRSAARSSP